MRKHRLFALVLSLSALVAAASREKSSLPLRQTELLALVAGDALPENIIAEIRSRGVAFAPNALYRSLLKAAGADDSILTALNAAKPSISTPEYEPNKDLLQRMSTTGKLIKEKQYDAAAEELAPALEGNFEKYELGFVIGNVLICQQRWAEASAMYLEVLKEAPEFPEAHTKLSFVLYRLGNGEEALREAKAALARTPQNAEAHKNAGLALHSLGKLDAAIAEYREALRLKPNYAYAHLDLALVLEDKHDLNGTAAEYKKALELNPNDANIHYNLGVTLGDKGDFQSAIREYREAKRLNPKFFEPRHNLASALMQLQLYAEAIQEFREIEALFPDSEICHLCLGRALHMTWDLKGAEKELREAVRLNPSDPAPVVTLGTVFEDGKNLDGAVAEYREAEELDPEYPFAHLYMGRVMLTLRNAAEAVKELKLATDLSPSDSYGHDLYGQALILSGDVAGAITEFRESLTLDSAQVNVVLELAQALERKGDWAAALNQYHDAVLADHMPANPLPGVSYRTYSAARKYEEAQRRFSEHLGELKKNGKAAEAAALKKAVSNGSGASDVETLDALMQSGSQAFQERRFDDAERDYKKAVALAEQIHPTDVRLATSLGHLGQLAAFRGDFIASQAFLERALKVTEQVYGSQNMALVEPLKWLAMNALAQKNLPAAEKLLNRALEVSAKTYGENSESYANMLTVFGGTYVSQQKFDKAEPYMLQASAIEEKLYGYDLRYGGMRFVKLWGLCSLYEAWGKFDKLESCDNRLIGVLEKDDSPDMQRTLEMILTRQSKTLRTLGRQMEADKMDKRLKSLQSSAAVTPN